MNWGYKLIVVIAVFLIAMLAMVGVAYKQSNEMVESNYYDKEINYQSLINAANNLNKATNDAILVFENSNLLLKMPTAVSGSFENGQIEFLKNDDKSKDLTVAIKPDSTGVFVIDKSMLLHGQYNARIRWTNAATLYYREQVILIP